MPRPSNHQRSRRKPAKPGSSGLGPSQAEPSKARSSEARSSKARSSRVASSKAKPPKQSQPLTSLSQIALALPASSRLVHGSHAQFLVGKKTFAYFLDNHHGDGIVAIACKVLPGDNTRLAEAQSTRFYLPAYIASRGWVALRLDRGKIDWDEVRELLLGSYTLVAPRKLAELVESEA